MKSSNLIDVKEYFLKNDIKSVHKVIKEDENGRPYVTFFYKNGNFKNIYFAEDIASNYKAGTPIVRFFFNNLQIASSNLQENFIEEFISKELDKTLALKKLVDFIGNKYKSYVEDDDNYPYVVLPQKIKDIEKGKIAELEQSELPQVPELKKQNYSDYFFSFLILILLVASIYFGWLKSTVSYLVFILGFLFFCYSIKETIKITKERKNKNLLKIKAFETDKQKIKKENDDKRILVETLKSENTIEDYKKQLIFKVLSKYSYEEEPTFGLTTTNKGRFEDKFKALLISIFQEKIKYNCSFNFMSDDDEYIKDCMNLSSYYDDDYSYKKFKEKWKHIHYVPDFIYKDESICINIEIDEPYTIDLNPIHCKNDPKEARRNFYFESKNWIIIRFSENQIATSPISCCLLIAYLIGKYTNNLEYIGKITQNYDENYNLKIEKRWTVDEANDYIKRKYREETILNSII